MYITQRIGIRFQERDRRLLNFLFENKVATLDQMVKYIYKTDVMAYPKRRIKNMVEAGIISRKFDAQKSGEWIYSIKRKMVRENHIDYNLEKGVHLGSYAELHDIGLVEVRECFSRFKAVKEYYTENMQIYYFTEDFYERQNHLKPDAIIEFEKENFKGYLPIELELTSKSAKRYRDILIRYINSEDFSLVVFICGSKRVEDDVRRAERKLLGANSESKIIYTSYHDVLNSKESLEFISGDGKCVTIS